MNATQQASYSALLLCTLTLYSHSVLSLYSRTLTLHSYAVLSLYSHTVLLHCTLTLHSHTALSLCTFTHTCRFAMHTSPVASTTKMILILKRKRFSGPMSQTVLSIGSNAELRHVTLTQASLCCMCKDSHVTVCAAGKQYWYSSYCVVL